MNNNENHEPHSDDEVRGQVEILRNILINDEGNGEFDMSAGSEDNNEPAFHSKAFETPKKVKHFSKIRQKIAAWLWPQVTLPQVLRSPYKDSTQIGILADVTFRPQDFEINTFEIEFGKEGKQNQIQKTSAGTHLSAQILEYIADGWNFLGLRKYDARQITMSGTTRAYQSFKPTKVVLTQTVKTVYGGQNLPDITISRESESASDVVLIQAFVGSYNCFPNAPSFSSGISGQVFSSDNGTSISWPTINAGLDVNLGFVVKPTVLYQSNKDELPIGYLPTPKQITLEVRANLLGPSLR